MKTEELLQLTKTYKGLFPHAKAVENIVEEMVQIFAKATFGEIRDALRQCAIESPNLPAIASLRKLIPNHRLEGDRRTTSNLVRSEATPEDAKYWQCVYWNQNQLKEYYYQENGQVKRKIDKIMEVMGESAYKEYKKYYGGKDIFEIVSLFGDKKELNKYKYFENLMFEAALAKEKEGKGERK